MKQFLCTLLCFGLAIGMVACGLGEPAELPEISPAVTYDGTQIYLSDTAITVDGNAISQDSTDSVYEANDIIYYETGKDFTYGEGDEQDTHTPQEAAEHTVVHITAPGQYVLTGKLSRGQIAVDLGENAKDDPNAVVTLVLNDADITCQVAPAVIFYRVYECGNPDDPSATVDTSKAGANVLLGEGTENNIEGAYVAKIYEPDSVVLSEDGDEVEDAKKLHKYDGAFYSKMSMNIDGSGTLNIKAANEGLDSEMHLTINNGNINIESGNDGINTNEDGVSVTTVNGGNLNILVNGATGEGDGIDSNGWLVINGGSVTAQACGFSGDAGIDSDMGIHINGGTVIATGNMLDRISESKQNYAVFQFAESQRVNRFSEEYRTFTLKDADGKAVISGALSNAFSYLIVSCPQLTAGEYTLWQGEDQLAGSAGIMGGGMGQFPGNMQMSEGGELPEMPEGTPPEGMENMAPPEGFDKGQRPEGMEKPEGMEMPEGMQRPGGDGFGGFGNQATGEISHLFTIQDGGSYFTGITAVTAVPIQ